MLLEKKGLEAGAVGQGNAAGDQQVGSVLVVEGLQLYGQVVQNLTPAAGDIDADETLLPHRLDDAQLGVSGKAAGRPQALVHSLGKGADGMKGFLLTAALGEPSHELPRERLGQKGQHIPFQVGIGHSGQLQQQVQVVGGSTEGGGVLGALKTQEFEIVGQRRPHCLGL